MSPSFSSGTIVGSRYRIDREIGRGGMAVVYLAWDEPHSRDVAVKVLSPSVAGALGVDRFVDEIRTTAGLSHPHILALLDSGHVDESPFYVMPYVRGESLRDRLKREEVLSLDEALRIASAVAGALAHAHAEGVIHRDIKPANILLDRAGNSYLADFGIARALSASADTLRTLPGQVLGTLQYMSPEQLTPEGEIDGTTDLYSLSCVVFEMLAGSPPFNASSPRALMAAHLLSAPPLLRSVRADIPRALDDLLQSGLAKNASKRIGAASEFARRLDDIRTTLMLGHVDTRSTWIGRMFDSARASSRLTRIAYAVGAALLVSGVALGVVRAIGPSARQEFALGQAALRRWDLFEAERHFDDAATKDDSFYRAFFWRAQVRNWQGQVRDTWAADARRAVVGDSTLLPSERSLATALVALADEKYPEACDAYRRLRESDPFAGWFGLGACQGHDWLVEADTTSPTGWKFRSSGRQAALAYQEAFKSLESRYLSFTAGTAELLPDLLYARPGVLRLGRGPDRLSFVGFKEWRNDTLAFLAVPQDSARFVRQDPVAADDALREQQRALYDVAEDLAAAFPSSGNAQYALGVAREVLGYPSALTTYREAKALAGDPGMRALAGAAEVMLSVRLAIPTDVDAIRRAVALGDSLLGEDDAPQRAADRLAELAVLLGRPNAAARLSRVARVGGGPSDMPTEVRTEALALMAFAAVGAPVDSIQILEMRVERLIGGTPSEGQSSDRQSLLEQPSFLAFPDYRLRFLESRDLLGSPYARAIAALESDGVEAARAALGVLPRSAGWDVLLAGANVMVATGQRREALDLVSARLEALATADPRDLSGVARVGAMVRAMALRAELEAAIGSQEAAMQWARAVEALWEGGDGGADPLLIRMRALLDAGPVG